MVGRVPKPSNQPGGHRPIDQPHRAVMAEQEMIRHLTDGRIPPARVAPDGQEELVLGRGEAHRGRLFLAPSQKPAETGAKLEESAVLGVREPWLAAHRGEIS